MSNIVVFSIGCIVTLLCIAFVAITLSEYAALAEKGDATLEAKKRLKQN